jgi:hypothetical protein
MPAPPKTEHYFWKNWDYALHKSKPAVSQDDLAGRLAALGVSLDRSAISRIENQSRYVMDYEAAAIARALKVSVAWLFGE